MQHTTHTTLYDSTIVSTILRMMSEQVTTPTGLLAASMM
jgi:hypothetical protein